MDTWEREREREVRIGLGIFSPLSSLFFLVPPIDFGGFSVQGLLWAWRMARGGLGCGSRFAWSVGSPWRSAVGWLLLGERYMPL